MQLARRLGHNLCIVVPPVRSDYRKSVGMSFNEAFMGLMEVCEQFQSDWDFSLLNCFDDTGFLDEDANVVRSGIGKPGSHGPD